MHKKLKFTKTHLLVGIILLVAFLLRTAWLRQNMFFGWEQGRDFLKLKEILAGDPVFIGPKTDVDGVFHGALSYYLLIPPFVLFGGNPYTVLFSLIVFNVAAIFFLYLAVSDFINKRTAFFVILFYSLSYSLIIYTRWLSNPSIVPGLLIFLLFFLVKARKDWRFLVAAAATWAIIFHLQIVAAATTLLPIAAFVFFEKIKTKPKQLLLVMAAVGAILSPYVLFNFKNNNILVEGVKKNFLAPGKLGVERFALWDEMSNEIVDSTFPPGRTSSLVIFASLTFIALVAAVKDKRKAYLLFFAFSAPLLFFLMGVRPLRHYFVTFAVFLPMVYALGVDYLWSRKLAAVSLVAVATIVLGNLETFREDIPESKGNFLQASQRSYFGDMIDLIDYMYADAAGEKISYYYYTFPYWQPQAWNYLFEWYGFKKYGYLPVEERADPMYVFMEPNEYKPVHRDNWYGEFKKGLDLVWSRDFGKLTLEKWQEAGKQ